MPPRAAMCRPGAFACPCAPTRPGAPTDRGEDRRPWSETRSVTNAGAPSRARPWPRVSPGSSVGRRPAQKQKTCKLVVYRFPASSRPCLGGEYEILSCVSHFFLLAEYQYFISLFLSGLRNFCPESVPGNNFNISVLFEKIRQNLLSDICTSGRTYLLDNALFLQQTIDGAMLFGDSVLL